MPTREGLANLGTARGRTLTRLFGEELRQARLSAGVSQANVASAAGVSQATISRIELAQPPYPDFILAARVARIVGLDLQVRCFPAGGQLRDVAHAALISRFVHRLPTSVKRELEVPIRPMDQRAWDAVLTVDRTRIGVIAETRIRDLQDLLRREHRKQLDSGVQHLLLLVARSKNNIRALSEARELIEHEFPLGTRAVMGALSRGRAMAANGLVMM